MNNNGLIRFIGLRFIAANKNYKRKKNRPDNNIKSDEKYYFADYVQEPTGKVKRISLKTDNEKEAYKRAYEIEKNFNSEKEKLRFENNLYSTDIGTGFNEFLDHKKQSVQNSTFAKESHIIIKFKEFLIKNQIEIIKDLTPDIIKLYFNNLKLSQKTISNHICMVNTIIKFFKNKSYLPDYFYFESSKYRKKIKKEKIRIINKDEARIIIDEFKQLNDIEKKSYLLIPFFTGLRFSEVKGLHRKNIDLNNRIITVCQKWTEETDFPESILKSSTAYRKIPIMNEYLPILTEHLTYIKEEFPFKNLSYNRIKKFYTDIEKKYNIKFHFHMGRHFFASLLIDSKLFSLKEIQTILGHSSINMTMDIYGHLIQDWNIKTFDKINF